MSFVTRVYELVVTVEEEYLNAFESDPAEREASRNECWEGIERDIQLSVRDLYGTERYRAIKIWRPQLLESEERHEKQEQ